MDQVTIREKIVSIIGQYKYVILVVLIGLALMAIPEQEEKEQISVSDTASVQTMNPQQELENILSQIEGVGKVKVLLTIAEGEQILYEYDEDRTDASETDSLRRETVIISNAERTQQGLVQQVIPPTYQGAIVVCQGGDKPSVQLAIVEAVSNATGLSADRITVLKMK